MVKIAPLSALIVPRVVVLTGELVQTRKANVLLLAVPIPEIVMVQAPAKFRELAPILIVLAAG